MKIIADKVPIEIHSVIELPKKYLESKFPTNIPKQKEISKKSNFFILIHP